MRDCHTLAHTIRPACWNEWDLHFVQIADGECGTDDDNDDDSVVVELESVAPLCGVSIRQVWPNQLQDIINKNRSHLLAMSEAQSHGSHCHR